MSALRKEKQDGEKNAYAVSQFIADLRRVIANDNLLENKVTGYIINKKIYKKGQRITATRKSDPSFVARGEIAFVANDDATIWSEQKRAYEFVRERFRQNTNKEGNGLRAELIYIPLNDIWIF